MDWNEAYRILNNNGKGFAAGNETDNINEIKGIGKLVLRAETNMDVAVYDDKNMWVIVGDGYGPWAMRVRKELPLPLAPNVVRYLEHEYNVYVDRDRAVMTRGERDDDYGWSPIPENWLLEAGAYDPE